MPKQICTDAEFERLFREHGAAEAARILGLTERGVYSRRKALEEKLDRKITSPNNRPGSDALYPARVPLEIKSGIVIVGSDPHYWPDLISTGHRAFVKFAKDFGSELKAVVLNGDAMDGNKISRHPPIGWPKGPTVKQEKAVVTDRLGEIEDAAKRADLFWNLGNHDYRFENRLSAQVPEMEGMPGFTLKDHFARWNIGISLWINDDVIVKHRYKGGIHATHNNTLWAGKTTVTGHLHSLKVTPFDDYNGTRYGVDTGTLADPYGPQFSYGEDNPVNHRSGFIVLTFIGGFLLWPEVVRVVEEGVVEFRGKLITV